MSTSITTRLAITSQEVLDSSEFPGASQSSDRTLRSSGFNVSATLDSTTTPAIEKPGAISEETIGASATTLDLTAIDVGIGRTEDMTGKKLIGYQFNASSSNSGDVTIAAGASNGYNLFGASGLLVLEPGESIAGVISGVASGKPAVSATVKNISISGTQNDVVEVGLWFGT